jgi:myb proto-oncogene protein
MEEGGGRGVLGNGNSQSNPSIYRPCPPLTAIDRFLYGQSHFSQQQTQNNAKNKQVLVSDNGFCSFPPFRGAIVDGFFVDGEVPLNWMHERNPNMGFKEEVKVVGKNSKSTGKKARKCSSEALIKGQWTDEEDR